MVESRVMIGVTMIGAVLNALNGYELVNNTVSGAVFCRNCSHHHSYGFPGKLINLVKSV